MSAAKNMLRLKVMEGISLDYPVYQGTAVLKDLDAISHVDRAMMDSQEGFQRELKKSHARKFREFVLDPTTLHVKKAAVPALIFSIRTPEFFFERKADGMGILQIPLDKTAMAQLDCQHRMAFTGDLDKQVPFTIFFGLSREEERALFTTFNDEHQGLTKSLVDKHRAVLIGPELPDIEPHLAIAVKLNEDPESPWFKAVNTGGEKTPGSKRLVALRTLQEATKVLIARPRCQNADFDTKYEAVLNYWKAVVDLFPDAWKKPRNHVITKGIGVHSLSAVGQDILEGCLAARDYSVAGLKRVLSNLSGLDWGNKTSVFANFSGKKGVKVTTALLNWVVFGDGDVEKLWEQARRVKV